MPSELRVDRIVPVNGVPTGGGGGIIQMVQGSTTTSLTLASTTFTDTGLSASITPTSSSNKILIIVYTGQIVKTANDTQFDYRLLRGSTGIYDASSLNTNSATTAAGNITFTYLDSPATTSSTTYKTQFSNRNTGTIYSNVNGTATITLMEVSG